MSRNNTVLVISEGQEQFASAMSSLRDAGSSVLFAGNVNHGLQIAGAELPGLIISELAMPHVDGLELCRRVRGDMRLMSTPILLVGDLSMDSSIVKDGLRCGASDYMEKPIDQHNLFDRCYHLIGLKSVDAVFDQDEDVFRSLIENISDIISIVAADGTILYGSPSTERILGYKCDELVGQSAFELVHPEDVAEVMKCFHLAIRSFSASTPIEYRIRHTDGSWQFIESIGRPINDSKCGLIVVVTSRDSTERKNTLEAKLESDTRLRTIFDNAALGIALVSSSGRVVKSNPALHRMLGYTADELESMSFVEITHPDDVDRDLALANEVLEGKRRNYQIEKRYITKSGEVIWGRLTVSAICDHNENPTYVIGMVENINDQKTALAALSDSEERFRAQYEGLPIPTFTWRKVDDVLIFESYNAAADKLTHGKLSTVIGKEVSDVFKESPEIIESFYRCAAEQITIPFNGPYCFTITGEVKHLDANFVFIKPDIVLAACLDITEQIEAEELVKKGQERFELISNATNDCLWDLDLVSNSLWLNEATYVLLGIRPGEVQPGIDDLYAAIHSEDRDRVTSGIRELINGGEKYWVDEFRMRSEGRADAHILGRGYLVYGDDGRAIRMIGAAIDITERKSAENALLHHKQLYESLIDSIEGIVWEADAKTLEFSFVSKQAERLLGYPTEQWIDEPNFWSEHLHPDDQEWVVAFRKSTIAKLEKHQFNYRIIAADGRIVWLHDIVTVDASDKDNVRWRGVMVDITARKQAERALAEANEHAISEYIRLLERLATLGQQLGAARDLNSVFKAITEFTDNSVPCSTLLISLYDKEKSVRKAIYIWHNGKEADVSELQSVAVGEGPVGTAIKLGEVVVLDDYLKSPDKDPTYIHMGHDKDQRDPRSAVIAPMKAMGEVIGVIEVQSYESAAYTQEHTTAIRMAANLTANAIENVRLIEMEQMRAEHLRQSQRLESVGRLAGGIAHDFNNMLTAINGYSDLTLRKLSADDPLRGNIEEIKKAGDRSALLTQQLLAFSRRQVLKPRVIDLNQTVTETGTLLERLIGEDIDLVLTLSPDLGSVEADPGQLTQVIINLAVNSRDAIPGGGKITIETANQDLDEEYAARHVSMRPGSYIMLAVSDTGIGMSQEVQEHLFEPFFTTKNTGRGTGLGLATVYGIVKQSGGYVWVYSEVGQGAVVKVYLPRVDAKAGEIQIGRTLAADLKGDETILLVEDEEIVRKLSKQILETCGYTVLVACDGTEALAICQRTDQKVDLLLTDVVMPKMSGRQLVQNLAEIRPGLRVLYMSGYTDDSIIRHGVIEAGEHFIQKPFTFNTLAGKVRKMCDEPSNI